jgi:hypothetical protein
MRRLGITLGDVAAALRGDARVREAGAVVVQVNDHRDEVLREALAAIELRKPPEAIALSSDALWPRILDPQVERQVRVALRPAETRNQRKRRRRRAR